MTSSVLRLGGNPSTPLRLPAPGPLRSSREVLREYGLLEVLGDGLMIVVTLIAGRS